MPDAPDNYTGFDVRCVLPRGHNHLCIEAQMADGRWQVLLARRIEVRRQWRPLWLGGGAWTELMFFQMPSHMKHSPRAVQPERLPPGATTRPHRPKLSIVTPSFQQASFLKETLLSVIEQKNVHADYVVQDRGSTDGSAEIIREYAKPMDNTAPTLRTEPSAAVASRAVQLTAWESIRDNGQADAIARGFAKTTGGPDDLMAWINSDDFYLPGTLAYVADYFARHPEVDVLYGHRVLVDEQSREIGRWFLPRHDDEVLRFNDFVPQETLFWRRRIWDKVGGIETSFKFAMDWDLLLRFQAAGANIVRVPYFLACFRIHSAQKTSAAMHDIGQKEITLLRERTYNRRFPVQELETHPHLIRYLRRSAWIEFLWRLGLRAR